MKPTDAYRKYGSVDKAWKLSNSTLTRQEFRKALNIGEYKQKVKIGPVEASIPSGGSTEDGRYRVCHFTDLHCGSKHFDKEGFEQFLQIAWQQGCRQAVCTGDILDGNRHVLLYDQITNRWDEQLEILKSCDIPPFDNVWFIDGNHDGYHSESAGFISGKLMANEMGWNYLGACLGYATIHGAQWELWHPAGGGGQKNTIRTIIYNRMEHYDSDVVALGHYHRFSTVLDGEAGRFGFSGGTFQKKLSEFANRITNPWDIGGTIVSYTIEDGIPSEFSAKFINVK